MSFIGSIVISCFFLLIVLTFYLNIRRNRRNRKNPFGNTFDFTKIPNSSVNQRKKNLNDN